MAWIVGCENADDEPGPARPFSVGKEVWRTMNNKDDNSLWESGLRRRLDVAEKARLEAFLQDHPDADAAADLSLNAAMRRLPNRPVATNFTHRVLEAVFREPLSRTPVLSLGRRWRFFAWWPKPVWVPLVVGVLLLSCQQYQSHSRRETAQSVARVSHATAWVSVDVLQNFDAINRLGHPVPVDEVLLAALALK